MNIFKIQRRNACDGVFLPNIRRAFTLLFAAVFAACALTAPLRARVSASDSGSLSVYKLADISLQVQVPDELVCFTQNVTSNNAYLELLGVSDVEELRSLMRVNFIYLEIVPKDLTYEILINGTDAADPTPFSELSGNELQAVFEAYLASCESGDDEKISEQVTGSEIYDYNGVTYFVTDMDSKANDNVTIHLRRYYTVMMGKNITFTLQTNQREVSGEMAQQLLDIVQSAEYKSLKKSVFDNMFATEIGSTLITLLVPIALLAAIAFIISRSSKKTSRQIAEEEQRLRQRDQKDGKTP